MSEPPFERYGSPGNVQVVRDTGRRYPGLLIQGDTLSTLLAALEEDAPKSYAAATLREWLSFYERILDGNGFDIPYSPRITRE